jgi:pimeloyl-ACP methyl ester carboxylesterase
MAYHLQENAMHVRHTAIAAALIAVLGAAHSASAADAPGFQDKTAQVNGTSIHYQVGGHGTPVVLLHGYAQTGHMWQPILADLARHHTVIVPDLRGAGASAKPDTGYDKKNMAKDIHELVQKESTQPAAVVGHDIGLMVAYAYAAQYPSDTSKVALMDAFLPGVGEWKNVWLLRDLWHFHFHGETALALVKGRERIYFEHFWNDFAADKHHSVKEADRRLYAKSYAQPNGMRAGFQYFKNFEQDAQDFAQFAQTKITAPMLVLSGEKAGGTFLIEQAKLVAEQVDGRVIAGSGHWLMDEAPEPTMAALKEFLQ